MRRLAIALLLAQGVVYPQDKPAASRETSPAPKISTATDSVAFNDDWRRVAQLGIDEAKMQFMRSYEQVDFDTWDRIVTQNRRGCRGDGRRAGVPADLGDLLGA